MLTEKRFDSGRRVILEGLEAHYRDTEKNEGRQNCLKVRLRAFESVRFSVVEDLPRRHDRVSVLRGWGIDENRMPAQHANAESFIRCLVVGKRFRLELRVKYLGEHTGPR